MKKFYLLTKTLLVAVCLLVGASNAWADEIYDFDYWANNGYSITTEGSYTSISGCSYAINVTDGMFTYSLNDRLAIRFKDSLSRDLWNLRNGHGLYCYKAQNIAFLNLKSGDKIILTLEGTIKFVSGYLSKESVAVVADDAFVSDAEYEVTADCNVHFNAVASGKIHKLKIIPAAAKVEAPSLSISSMSAGASAGLYHPVISVSSSEATSYGASFTPDGGEAGAATITDGKYTFTQAGTLSVWGIKAGSSNSAVSKIYLESVNYILDASNSVDLSDEDLVDCSSWTSKVRDWANWSSINDKTFYTVEATNSFPGMTLNSVSNSSYCPGVGLYYTSTTGGGRTVTLTGSAVNQLAEGVYYSGTSTASTASKISLVKSAPFVYTLSQKVPVKCFNLYTPSTDVEIAKVDCKAYDTSDAFATAIDAQSFASAAEVYAFNTTYHITNGALTEGVRDITGVIRNAAIADGTDWDGATILSGEKYEGAPDEYYLDKNTGSIDASQTIYGLPAGVYVLKAATRAKAGTSGNIYVWDGTNTTQTAINANGNTGGDLDRGWDWTEVTFYLSATSNVKIGFYANVDGYWASCDDFHLQKIESVPVALGTNGYATFASKYPLDATSSAQSSGSFEAYKAAVSGTKVLFSAIDQWIGANNGILVKGEPSTTVYIPVQYNGTAVSENEFLVNEGGATFAGDDDYTYFGMIKNSDPLTFGTFAPGTVAIPADKAYLKVADGELGARSLIAVFDEITGVENIEATAEAKAKEGKFIENGNLVIFKNGMKFNANGARIY